MQNNNRTKEYGQLMAFADRIKNKELKKETMKMIDELPDWFWHVPASSSGKYHPEYALGDGGLARHTVAACVFAKYISETDTVPDAIMDSVFAALILHDSCKQGTENEATGQTVFAHPVLAAEKVRSTMRCPVRYIVARAIETHMGKWNTSKYDDTVLPTPATTIELIVHRCDYLASRKDISINLDSVETINDIYD